MASPDPKYDAIVIGGGPAGATAAMVLARAGGRALVLEKARFPRFRIGESLLPRNFKLFEELGLVDDVRALPHVSKLGVEFGMGDGAASVGYPFTLSLLPGSPTFNLERAPFDQMLLNKAREAGAEVREGEAVGEILELADGSVRVATADGAEHAARWLIDASGQATVLGRALGTRRNFPDDHLKRVAYYGQFENVWRHDGEMAGFPLIVMCDEGWFWLIPLDAHRTSVGLVIHPDVQRQAGVPASRMLAWGIARSPLVRQRLANARGPATNLTTADFSYACRPYAGPGYFLAGDAATFLDPTFSSGVCLGMMAGQQAANHVMNIQRGRATAARARDKYARFINSGTSIFYKLIRQYYDHSFRELFLSGGGPLGVHRAVLAVLAGQVFPKPVWALRWRLRLFDAFIALNKRVRIVPKRERFSLLAATPADGPSYEVSGEAPVRASEPEAAAV